MVERNAISAGSVQAGTTAIPAENDIPVGNTTAETIMPGTNVDTYQLTLPYQEKWKESCLFRQSSKIQTLYIVVTLPSFQQWFLTHPCFFFSFSLLLLYSGPSSIPLAMKDLPKPDDTDRTIDDVIKESITVLKQTIPRNTMAVAPVMPDLS